MDEAIASYDKALSIKPDLAPAWCNRGVALRRLKRPHEALASYDRALAIRPEHPAALLNRRNTLSQLKRHGEALADYDRLLALKHEAPRRSSGVATRSLNSVVRMRRWRATTERFRSTPSLPEALCNRGLALKRLERFDEALASYDEALSINPDFTNAPVKPLLSELEIAEGFYGRGGVLQEMGRWDEALSSYDKSLSIRPDSVEVLCRSRPCYGQAQAPGRGGGELQGACAQARVDALSGAGRSIAPAQAISGGRRQLRAFMRCAVRISLRPGLHPLCPPQ